MTTALWILLGIGILIALAIIGFTIISVVAIKSGMDLFKQ